MRVRIITLGAQGDVRPYVALGEGLRGAGHDVRIVAHNGFEALVRNRGLEFAPIAGDPRHMDADSSRRMSALMERGRSVVRWVRAFKEVEVPLMRARLKDVWEACQNADAIVVSTLPFLFGYAVAKKLQVPLVRAFYFPVSPTSEYPVELLPKWLSLGARLNLATYDAQRQLIWQVARPSFARACRDVLGLGSLPRLEPFGDLDRRRQLLLYGYSPAVAPPPADWGKWIDVTGYWFLDRAKPWSPSPELTAFLDDGPSPVCIGFGSMNYDSAELMQTIERALALAGKRAVLLAGWSGLRPPELPGNMFALDWADLNWLFPRMAAVVHHGGAGTTADGLRAGVPTVVVPFFYDQFFWGRRVFELGTGPQPIPRRKLDAQVLARAIQTATSDPQIRRRACAVAAQIQAEDGVGRAVAAFQRHFGLSQ